VAINLIIAVTDKDWFEQLRSAPDLDEVNFWSPSESSFRALRPGELFLFKLHAPLNFIVGGGVFLRSMNLPCSYAWDTFGEANGTRSLVELRQRIAFYRDLDPSEKSDFRIGCRILVQPFFLDESQWVRVPESWSPNIVRFKRYDTASPEGHALWEMAESHLSPETLENSIGEERTRFGDPVLIAPRLGQGAFRALVTDIYQRRCAVTGERTLPALEAAHIRPYAEGGLHQASNGLLLRRDIHSLFDLGYVTVTPQHVFEVSGQIKEEFENGKDYYRLHGNKMAAPSKSDEAPDPGALEWHNIHRYMG
jgi:putative restriction endonuclease